MSIPTGIAVVNESPSLPDGDLARMVDAINEQETHDVAPEYSRTPVLYTVFRRFEDVPAGTPYIKMSDTNSVHGTSGWHTDENGVPFGLVWVIGILKENGGSLMSGPASVSVCLSHEGIELGGDPFVNEWCDGPDGQEYAKERCDPTQDQSYDIGGISVSNFVTGQWFNPSALLGEKFDHLGLLPSSFSRSDGGYIIVRRDGVRTQLGERPSWKHVNGRAARRMK